MELLHTLSTLPQEFRSLISCSLHKLLQSSHKHSVAVTQDFGCTPQWYGAAAIPCKGCLQHTNQTQSTGKKRERKEKDRFKGQTKNLKKNGAAQTLLVAPGIATSNKGY